MVGKSILPKHVPKLGHEHFRYSGVHGRGHSQDTWILVV